MYAYMYMYIHTTCMHAYIHTCMYMHLCVLALECCYSNVSSSNKWLAKGNGWMCIVHVPWIYQFPINTSTGPTQISDRLHVQSVMMRN